MSRLTILVILSMFVCTVITRAQSPLSAEQASELAARLANDECHRRFGGTPFKAPTAVARLVNGRWNWQALAGVSRADVIAKVSFSSVGQEPSVSVELTTGVEDNGRPRRF